MKWYFKVLKNYVNFSGRATRTEYWMFVLINLLITLAIILMDLLLFPSMVEDGMGILGMLYALAVLLPYIAVTVRRLHDIGKSGWWYLLALVPIAGIVLLIFTLLESAPDNQYGEKVYANSEEF